MPQTPNSVQPPLAGENREPAAPGKVYLVGAGPGDPGLITVRGAECLRRADVVLYDGLANAELLQLAPGAECICVGKHGQTPHWSQSDIHLQLLAWSRQGKCVVRLKGGDPAVFARTAEELEVLAAAHIPFEVVPGITAALAAASYAGIPLTHRRHASAVALITGQQQADGEPQQIDWEALVRFPGTLVFYMGVTTAEQWTGQLLRAGKAPQTPAAIVRRCTWGDQQLLRCTLAEVSERLTPASRMRPPVIVIVGEVAALGTDFDWYSARPLHGCGVLVTRAAPQADELSQRLRELGAQVYRQPVLEVGPPRDYGPLDNALEQLAQGACQGITFSSVNGVDGFFQRAAELGHDARLLAGCRIAAVGPATAGHLTTRAGLRADVVPQPPLEYCATALLQTLGDSVAGETWIVTSTQHSRDTLTRGLAARGATPLDARCYETRPVEQLDAAVAQALANQQIHFATVTSSLLAESSHRLLGEYCHHVQPISLSSKISATLAAVGWPAVGQAQQNTAAALANALVAAWRPT
ncbi:MAG: uroporphyrinogen-III C-methyltransferase [Planctomycetales bacterium]|nr:uroporphyrinogen-III C-methyltransferase [Planctomycetales bacterium]